jgi:hypothetical protein
MFLLNLVVNMAVGAVLLWTVTMNKDFVATIQSIYHNGEMVRIYQEALEYELPD